MSETFRLQWDRELHGERAGTRRIRFRRQGGEWAEVDSIDELPEDVRAAYEKSRGTTEPDVQQGSGVHRVRPIRHRKLPQTREIDRTLYIDHPWYNGCMVVMFLIAVPYMAYISWDGIGQGGWISVGGVLMFALTSFLAYYGLCLIVNSTEFRVDGEFLTVRHGPLPWYGHRTIPVNEIVQLSTHMHRSRNNIHYSIRAMLRNGRSVQVLEYADTEAQARSIERAIERHLGIEDWEE